MKGHINILIGAILIVSLSAQAGVLPAKVEFGNEQQAKEKSADKVLSILQSADFAVGQYASQESAVDRNSLNPFGSDTTYHSYTWSYCLEWVDVHTCERWLDPYVSQHGAVDSSEKSPLEGKMAEMWKSLKKEVDGNAAKGDVQYGIWSVRGKEGRSILDQDNPIRRNALDPEALADWRLLPEVEKEAEQIGLDTAEQAIRNMVDAEEGEEDQTMPDLASLRTGAATLTRALRNRLLSNIGEARASQPGIEFELGEDRPTCEAYLQNYEQYEKQGETPGAIPLNLRELETRVNNDVQKRYELCKQVTSASIYQVNPDIQGDKIELGSPDLERYDAAINRINVAMLDNAGMDPSSQPKPSDAVILPEDVAVTIASYAEGGAEYYEHQMTNAEQLAAYNQNLQQAAANMKVMADRAPDAIEDTSEIILASQIQIGSKRVDQINGLTDQMKKDLAGTKVKDSVIFQTTGVRSSDPDHESIEIAPSQLTITTLGN